MSRIAESKPFKTFEEQLEILESRGLIVKDRNYAIHCLELLNYYRLSAYSLTLRKNNKFYPGITIENIVQLYFFDATFRNIILTYTPYIENSFRTYIAYYHAKRYGPFGYLNNQYFQNEIYHSEFIVGLKKAIDKSKEIFVKHYKDSYNGNFPFWVAIEVTTFGTLSKLYKNLLNEDQDTIARAHFPMSRIYIENWLQCAVIARNVSAHGGRFYNRDFRFCRVVLPSNMSEKFSSSSPFAYVFAVYNLLPTKGIKDEFISRLLKAFADFPFARSYHLGFPYNWTSVLKNNFLKK